MNEEDEGDVTIGRIQLPDGDNSDLDEAAFLEECVNNFRKTDFIMEPDVFAALSRYFQSGDDPEPVVELLSKNYVGLAQVCSLLGDWLVELGTNPEEVKGIFETHLSSVIARHFVPKRADQIFEQQGEAGIEWLPQLIAHPPWRSLIYSLAEEFPDCLMLNFAVKLISDAGFQHEISSVTTAAQQLEIFSRVLITAIDGVLSQTPATDDFHKAVTELVRVACHSEHSYLYTQCLLHLLAKQEQQTKGGAVAAVKFLSQIIRLAGNGISGDPAGAGAQDTTAMTLALHNSDVGCNPALIQALYSMLSRQALNPADITLLYNWFNQANPPPLGLIRDPIFIDLLLDALFGPKAAKLHPDHRPKYVFLLAFATNAFEYVKKGSKKVQVSLEAKHVEETTEEVERISELCQGRGDTSMEVLAELPVIFQSLRVPAVAAGVLHWVQCTVTEPDYFQLHPEPLPVHLALLDEIASLHHLLHSKVFDLLKALFRRENAEASEAVGEELIERQKTFIDRMVHLLSVGCALPVTEFMAGQFREGSIDTSLIRYFVTESLDVIGPPFSPEFVNVFLPLVKNKEIVEDDEKLPSAKEFLEHCRQ